MRASISRLHRCCRLRPSRVHVRSEPSALKNLQRKWNGVLIWEPR